jgi:hypothetical protein
MKKLLLCGLAITVALSVSAQNRVAGKKQIPLANASRYNKVAKATKSNVGIDNFTPLSSAKLPSINNHSGQKSAGAVTETVIGNTVYDLQSNRGPARRIVNNGDGTISAAWTFSANASGYPDRGTGYNYYDGSSWGTIPAGRLEALRTGFTNIAVSGGNEYTLTHNGTGQGVLLKRTKGAGAWTAYSPVGNPPSTDVWFRMAAGGPNGNTIHAIVNAQGSGTTPVLGQSGPLTYSRSNDGGLTWDIASVVLPGADSSFYAGFSAENYSIDCSGNTVVIVAADLMTDVVMFKSTDNGTTWNKTIIDAAAIPAYNTTADYAPLISDVDNDGVADTILTSAGDPNVTLDPNGNAHVTWSAMTAFDDDTTAGTSLGIFLTTDPGIFYWNEVTGGAPQIVAGLVDQNNDGVFTLATGNGTDLPFGRYGNGGLVIHPQIGFNGSSIYIAYSAVSEVTDTLNYGANLRHIFVTGSTDNGATWTEPLDIVPSAAQGGDGEYQEAVWPSIAKSNGGCIHIVYQRDPAPEYFVNNTSVYGPQNTSTNDIIYVCVPENDVLSVNEVASSSESFTMSQNYPNPYTGTTSFDINLKNSSDVTVEVYNVLGKLVSTNNYSLNAGSNKVSIDANGFTSGLYTYSVKVGAEKVTRTMMVK